MLFCLVILVGCSFDSGKNFTDGERFKEEYESLNGKDNDYGKVYRSLELNEDNPFVYASAEDIIEMMEEKESFVIYFGFSSCPWCRSMISNLIDVSLELGISDIYYVDVKEIRDVLSVDERGEIVKEKEGSEDYYTLLEKLDMVLEDYVLTDKDDNEVLAGEKRIYAPNVVSVVDGVATEMTDGISSKQTDGYMELTEEMNEESYDKIKCSIQCVADSKKVCDAKSRC